MDEILNQIVNAGNNVLWAYILIPLLLIAGLYFTVRTGFVQFTYFKEMIRLLGEGFGNSKDGISSFQAFTMSTASRVGTGNMAGVALAIAAGGPGAVFWMWLIALLGSASAFVESTLAQIYKIKNDDGTFRGGPAYYMERGLKSRGMGIAFSILITLCFGFVFNAVQSDTISAALEKSADTDPFYIGLVLVVLTAAIIFGGAKRIATFTEVLVPIMAIAYLLVALYVVFSNVSVLPEVFSLIIKGAFGLEQAAGGAMGAAVMQGIKRGLFSNEAGMGSAPNAAATAEVSHPVKQGLIQTLGVFTDTLLICTATAFMVLVSGAYLDGDATGIQLTQESVTRTVGSWGVHFISVCIFMFAFSSIVGNYYYGESNILFISTKKRILFTYRVLVLGMVMFGALASSTLVWNMADLFMGLMAVLNIYAIMRLYPIVDKALKDYRSQKAAGRNPEFKAKDIGLENEVDCW